MYISNPASNPKESSCAFIAMDTGKLPFKYDELKGNWVHYSIRQQLKRHAREGVTSFYSDLSRCLGLWAALYIGDTDMTDAFPSVRLSLFLPYIGQARHWSAFHRELYNSCIKEAPCLNQPSEKYTRECVSANHREMIDRADRVLFYTTESDRVVRKAVEYARERNKYIEIIDPVALRLRVEKPDVTG